MPGLSIPEDYPLAKLNGQEVTQVSIGRHYVILTFYKLKREPVRPDPQWEEGARIAIEAGFRLQQPDGLSFEARNENLGTSSGCLTSLLGRTILRTDRLPENELLIRFSGGEELQLITDSPGFESYHLHIDGDSVDVTKP